ncbi:MAG: thymidylate synthase [Candidatus Woesearchaeota archaeon]
MNNANQEYHNYLKWVITHEKSVYKGSRAGGTIANTGAQMKFDLSEDFPIINTKKAPYRGVLHEMIWFINGPEKDGQMHIDYLVENKCGFWDKDLFNFNNTKKGIKYDSVAERDAEFEVFQKNLQDPEFRAKFGSLGRPYGAQWRTWNSADKILLNLGGYALVRKGKPVDQLANAFEAIKKHSDSRRIKVEAWRPDELSNMALPPCHTSFQFVVMNDRLDITMWQRSADSFLGVLTNIMHYGIMGKLGAEYAGLKPGILTHQIVDGHIYCGVGAKVDWYKNNLSELKERMSKANTSEDYLKIKNWIDTTADRDPNPMYEEYDHVTAVLEQLSRDVNKYPLPKLEVIIDKNKSPKELLDTLSFNNFKVAGYKDNHYGAIPRRMPTG